MKTNELKKPYLVLDIETTGLNPVLGDEVTCICADSNNLACYHQQQDEQYNEYDILSDFFEWLTFEKLDEESIAESMILVTKNGKRFDIPFLVTRYLLLEKEEFIRDAREQIQNLLDMQHIDIHEVTKKWVSLEDMATILGVENKSSNGFEAINMFKQKRYKELMAYCQQDVKVTHEVFLKMLSSGALKC